MIGGKTVGSGDDSSAILRLSDGVWLPSPDLTLERQFMACVADEEYGVLYAIGGKVCFFEVEKQYKL